MFGRTSFWGLLALVDPTPAVLVQLGPGKRECFVQDLYEWQTMHAGFEVIGVQAAKVQMDVFKPGHEDEPLQRVEESKYEGKWKIDEAGL